jgi:uncharacterized protein
VSVEAGIIDERSDRAFWASICTFYGLAIAISWTAWAPLYLGRSGLGWLPIAVPMPWTITGTLGPAIAATLVRRLDRRGPTFRQLLAPGRGTALGTLSAVVVVGATFVLGTALILTREPPRGWAFGALGLYGFHALLTLLGGPIFEEWGWRGFAQPRLQTRIGALPAALVIGPAWAFWHLPLFLVPAWSSASPFVYLVLLTGLSVTLAWGLNIAAGWIVAAILMHDVFNGSSRVLGGFLANAEARAWPDPPTAIALAFAAVAVLLVLSTRGRLGRETTVA